MWRLRHHQDRHSLAFLLRRNRVRCDALSNVGYPRIFLHTASAILHIGMSLDAALAMKQKALTLKLDASSTHHLASTVAASEPSCFLRRPRRGRERTEAAVPSGRTG